MRTITINLETKTASTKVVSTDKWYVRAETAIKEAVHEVQETRETANAIRQSLRAELDAQYREQAKAQMVRLMAKRGLDIKFN